ncbi:SlyX protein [Devosia crocina]|uniref:Protein SlyX homolog n=1 Tax=Devosia crocina TaxID=429728 RepID=A0A1I7MWZ1_9HYPH|nr:SlyX family protein [Devosia crocina]SFV26910.1 SlyX protein [Devosia crocina]
MSDRDQLERLEKLESRVAFQDHTIDELNQVITEQWSVIEQLRRKLDAMEEQVRSGSYIADPATEKPPPHY